MKRGQPSRHSSSNDSNSNKSNSDKYDDECPQPCSSSSVDLVDQEDLMMMHKFSSSLTTGSCSSAESSFFLFHTGVVSSSEPEEKEHCQSNHVCVLVGNPQPQPQPQQPQRLSGLVHPLLFRSRTEPYPRASTAAFMTPSTTTTTKKTTLFQSLFRGRRRAHSTGTLVDLPQPPQKNEDPPKPMDDDELVQEEEDEEEEEEEEEGAWIEATSISSADSSTLTQEESCLDQEDDMDDDDLLLEDDSWCCSSSSSCCEEETSPHKQILLPPQRQGGPLELDRQVPPVRPIISWGGCGPMDGPDGRLLAGESCWTGGFLLLEDEEDSIRDEEDDLGCGLAVLPGCHPATTTATTAAVRKVGVLWSGQLDEGCWDQQAEDAAVLRRRRTTNHHSNTLRVHQRLIQKRKMGVAGAASVFLLVLLLVVAGWFVRTTTTSPFGRSSQWILPLTLSSLSCPWVHGWCAPPLASQPIQASARRTVLPRLSLSWPLVRWPQSQSPQPPVPTFGHDTTDLKKKKKKRNVLHQWFRHPQRPCC